MNQFDYLIARMDELETKVAFQENTIEQLNQALIEQQFIIDKMQLQLRYLAQKLKDVQPSNIATQAEETPPPHY
ncbi:SlyX family protein [Gallibacterium anatis]|jgi:SlyX protein|uniref:Protein SlyX homolog n=2 Tax=Gallibacterium anatis TaxID=750 RepID=A0A0A3AZL8_9PAST|nr:SlyX family protein [Gallibacterium anatis]ERF77804.1 phi X174 lysis protein [Gallibacterium anatis 12656/12]KGQ24907.1 SlyX [Gallibacterium anatis CCM5995]KGQ28700.1 SlyX [Gallibacterium anatis]KGQ28921.1 SlyX [Gallibacterium anatis]KGQ30131.1 SlyX [Gallibacterium anatis]